MTVDELKARVALPVITAPMFLVSGIELVVAACRNGVIGSFPALNARTPALLGEWLETIDRHLSQPSDTVVAPFCVNIVLRSPFADEQLEICAEAAVPIVITSVGDPTETAKRVHDWGGLLFHDVTNLRHAEKAAAAGVDGIILVCAGAGGHSGAQTAFALAPQVRSIFGGAIIIGGGIADGRAILATQALGADFAYVGTRFIATSESLASDPYKRMLIEAETSDIVYTERISGLPASFVRQSLRASGLDPENLPALRAPRTPDLPPGIKAWKDIWSAGQGVGLIDRIATVPETIRQLRDEYDRARAELALPPSRHPEPIA
jgi:nitronate monooxygenase